jgi:hypothetical protein
MLGPLARELSPAATVALCLTHPEGIELIASSPTKTVDSAQGGANGGAPFGISDSETALSSWLDACPIPLPDATKAAILAMVKEVSD